MNAKELKSSIIQAGYKAVHELIRVAEEEIIVEGGDVDRVGEGFSRKLLERYLAEQKEKLCWVP